MIIKSRFDQWLWYQAAAIFSHYHGDNGIFSAVVYQHNCNKKGKTQSFYGVHAQHQSAQYERAIKTVMCMDPMFIVHSSLNWYERGSDDISLWYFDVKNMVRVYNQLTSK